MLATERLLEIEGKWAEKVQRIVVLEIDGETLHLIIYLEDGTNLRVTEQWAGTTLAHYSYYWLNSANEFKIGWDNAPHYTRALRTFHTISTLDKGRIFRSPLKQLLKR